MYATYFSPVISMIYVVGESRTGAVRVGLDLSTRCYTILGTVTKNVELILKQQEFAIEFKTVFLYLFTHTYMF